jgi:hypothetical protein
MKNFLIVLFFPRYRLNVLAFFYLKGIKDGHNSDLEISYILESESIEEMRVTGFCDPWKRCARCLGLLREMGCVTWLNASKGVGLLRALQPQSCFCVLLSVRAWQWLQPLPKVLRGEREEVSPF